MIEAAMHSGAEGKENAELWLENSEKKSKKSKKNKNHKDPKDKANENSTDDDDDKKKIGEQTGNLEKDENNAAVEEKDALSKLAISDSLIFIRTKTRDCIMMMDLGGEQILKMID
ncbi:hypothetical protein Fot_05360 [Forsythia ovata]|uniref:Uncharacterized protein n=1 Tax=Forsythia ovata TaxID=205694 RepID=A0ABD1WPX4_9LAMI